MTPPKPLLAHQRTPTACPHCPWADVYAASTGPTTGPGPRPATTGAIMTGCTGIMYYYILPVTSDIQLLFTGCAFLVVPVCLLSALPHQCVSALGAINVTCLASSFFSLPSPLLATQPSWVILLLLMSFCCTASRLRFPFWCSFEEALWEFCLFWRCQKLSHKWKKKTHSSGSGIISLGFEDDGLYPWFLILVCVRSCLWELSILFVGFSTSTNITSWFDHFYLLFAISFISLLLHQLRGD